MFFTSLLQLQLKIQDEAATVLPYGAVKANPLGVFISNILPLILVVAVFLVLFLFIQAGLDWISAGGDKGKIEKAREKITGTVIGLIVLFSAFAIFLIMQRLLGFSVLNLKGGASTTGTGAGGSAGTGQCISCPGGSCADGWTYGPDTCAPQATCAQRAIEGCAPHGGQGTGGTQQTFPLKKTP